METTARLSASHRRHALLGGVTIDKKQSSLLYVGVAQLVEHRTHKPGVVGSIPTPDTMNNMKKLQFYTLRIFLACMVLCAILVLSIVWSTGPDHFTIVNQLAMSSFIVGLASFLVWLVTIILEVRDRIEKK